MLPTFGIGHVPNTVKASGHVYTINYLTYWTAFCSLVIGLGASLLGGMMGGAMQRSVDDVHLDLHRMESQVSTDPVVRAAPQTTTAPVTATVPVVPVVPVVPGDTGSTPVVYEHQLR